jgi:hypothetical protein
VSGIFLDLSKAFDTVMHEILLSKLVQHGIRRNVHDHFISYLKICKQLVFNGDVISSLLDIQEGVPQGSVLETILP